MKTSTFMWRWIGGVTALCFVPCAQAYNPNALWEIVHGYCEPAALGASVQQKCAEVNVAEGYAVLKDINGQAQYLLIPTRRIAGIESAELLTPGSPNYWRAAWRSRGRVAAALGRDLPREALSLAVNSASGRTQNQLHIHIDCLAVDVIATLRANEARIGTDWTPLPVLLRGHAYRVRRIDDAGLDFTDPFKLLAPTVAREGRTMGEETLLLAGAVRADGTPAFYLLNDQTGPGDAASSEELQDHGCKVAAP